MKETFREKYISKRLENYTLTTREDVATSKGHKIPGLLKPKFEAALFCALFNWPKKKIARELKMSFDVLRKFCTEQAFKHVIENIQNDFALSVVGHLRRRAVKKFKLTKKYLAIFDDAFESPVPPPLISFREFRDVRQYSQDVISKIIQFVDLDQFKLRTENVDELKPWILIQIDRFIIEVLLPYFSKDLEEYNTKLARIMNERDFTLPDKDAHHNINMELM